MKRSRDWSLATVVSFHCTWIVALFMGAYGTMETWVFGGGWTEALFRHAFHVALISFGLLVILHIVLHRTVARPIARISAQLYRLGAGADEMDPIETSIREIRQIVRGIELMRERRRGGAAGSLRHSAEPALEELREQAKRIHSRDPEASRAILEATARLQGILDAAS
ncbi:HAMP domain-containing protein [Deferrisoma camini]|uniref:HAMP domain-containing protein n=1 Tax=Deferrisoma camini TaxID=1035120 RepID=UPI00046D5C88|nr:HAMP domain-containing protein [Deferrisoma camini]